MQTSNVATVAPEASLRSLLALAQQSQTLRLVARPQHITVDQASGQAQRLAVPWSEQEHAAAQQAVQQPQTFADGSTASSMGSCVLVQRPVAVTQDLAQLVASGYLSPLCAGLLGACMALGRNILVLGPWAPSVALLGALGSGGNRPALLGPGAHPPHFVQAAGHQQAATLGADRYVAWGLAAAQLVDCMGSLCGVAGWLDARRLDRGLMRFETAASRSPQAGADATLQVLASIDLVVVVHATGTPAAPRVQQVAELQLQDSGYRPHLLFDSGLKPAPQALVPVGQPSFAAELQAAGYAELVAQLQHAMPAGGSAAGSQDPSSAAQQALEPTFSAAQGLPSSPQGPAGRGQGAILPVALGAPGSIGRMRAAMGAAQAPSAPALQAASAWEPSTSDDAPESDPGWELDRLPAAAEVPAHRTAGLSAEEAQLAALHGLAPPPRPRSAGGFEAYEPAARPAAGNPAAGDPADAAVTAAVMHGAASEAAGTALGFTGAAPESAGDDPDSPGTASKAAGEASSAAPPKPAP
jgi:hypothetical protein